LLDAARVEFAQRGYERATVRRIAERAGVDAAMVNHWFGGKAALFTAALAIPVDPDEVLATILPGDPDRIGERVVERFLTVWDVTGGEPLAAMVHSIAGHDAAARMMREFIVEVLVGRIVAAVSPDQHDLRAGLVGAQVFGLGMVRYVLKLEPVTKADHATLVAAVAPAVQRYLTAPLT
jgi:AcrR family transcriptional regulator